MTPATHGFATPPVTHRADGGERRVGFELEFSGISLADTAEAILAALDAERAAETAAAVQLVVPRLGDFTVEIDWSFLKRKAEEVAHGELHEDWESDLVTALSRAAPLLVPIEVVCPPVALSQLDALTPMVEALRASGAVGTEESLIAAYGVHINAEIPALDAATLGRYLRAFALLQWWLIDAHDVDPMRRLTPYIDPYPESYLQAVVAAPEASLDQIFADYLEHNATRNRALDLLPLLAEIDEDRVRATVDDPRIKARPTFHYRLPNCHIEREDWSLDRSWNIWCAVENLAADDDALAALSADFLAADRPVIGVSRGAWVKQVDTWLHDRGLV